MLLTWSLRKILKVKGNFLVTALQESRVTVAANSGQFFHDGAGI